MDRGSSRKSKEMDEGEGRGHLPLCVVKKEDACGTYGLITTSWLI